MRLAHFLLMPALAGLAGCAVHAGATHDAPPGVPPPMLLGDFVDDYGIGHRIGADEWLQRPDTRYRVVAWHPDAQYLVARNDAGNRSDAGRWTRIDWIALPGMPPWEWAFCLSAFDAATRAEAEATSIARRDTPKTGCNGYPFSRMRRVVATPG
ncbi:MAG TPA: hypothetical protein VLC71_00570 [Thermomonas sp.]|nr:hypothetical protein [Thermomonas sp.]